MRDNIKPVWRLNTGNGVPSDLGGGEVYVSNFVGIRRSNDLREWGGYWVIGDDINIYAYQTNRTKPAKYARTECKACHKSRFKGLVYCGGYFEYRKCPDCNGAGHVWEAL